MKRFFVLGIFFLLVGGWVGAQNDSSSLYFTVNGNLYAYNGEQTTLLTRPGYADRLSISADGSLLVYRAVAPEVLAAGGPTAYKDIPRSIMLMDTASGKVRRISIQPPNASDSIGIVRDHPTFSPDGQQLTWWEVDYEGEPNVGQYNNHRLVVYDIPSGETTIRLIEPENLPITRGATLYEIAYEPLQWGDEIAYHANGATMVIAGDEPVEISDTICDVEELQRLEGWAEMPTDDAYLVYTAQNEEVFYLIDPQAQQCYRTESHPLYRARNAPTDSLQLDIYPIDDDVRLLNAAGESVLTLPDPFSHLSRNKLFALHPAGQALAAYHRLERDSENGITIWDRDGMGTGLAMETLEQGKLPGVLPEVVWGGVELVLPEDTELTPVGGSG